MNNKLLTSGRQRTAPMTYSDNNSEQGLHIRKSQTAYDNLQIKKDKFTT